MEFVHNTSLTKFILYLRMKSQITASILIVLCLFAVSCKKEQQPEPAETTPSSSSPQVSTSPITGVTDVSAIGGGAVISNGGSEVTESGIVWDTLPGADLSKGSKTVGAGSNYTCSITGLKSFTRYYVKAYAKNSVGTAFGSEISFLTGDVWNIQSIGTTTLPGINCLKNMGDKIYAGTGNGVYYSPDGGDSWQAIGFSGKEVLAIGLSESVIFAGLSDHSVYRTENNGQSWVLSIAATAAPMIRDIAVAGDHIFRTEYNGIFVSSDKGDTWVNANPSPSYALQFSRLMYFSNAIYTPSGSYTSLYKTKNNGLNWQLTTDLNLGVYAQYQPEIDHVGNTLLFGIEKGLYHSEDEGTTWIKYSELPGSQSSISAFGQDIFYANHASKDFSISNDGGKTWSGFTNKGIISLPYGIDDVLICAKSIFVYSSVHKAIYRFRR